MLYNHELKLITQVESKDNIGNITTTETETTIYAKPNKVGSNEFYNAVGVGITPTAELQIKKCNYNNEKFAKYDGKKYMIIRTIPVSRNDIVLVLGIKEGHQ